jgi:GNAT superfamily N-acetyltransferase
MSVNLPFILRDGHEKDIAHSLALDHSYESDLVWQVQVERDEPNYYSVTFRAERLPRTLQATYPQSETRLRIALQANHCYLVAAERESGDILGYLAMVSDPAHRIVTITDLLVDRTFRRKRIGGKLLNIARRWGREHQCEKLLIELQTRNYPGIAFCQASGMTFCGYNERYFDQQEIAVFFGQTLR